MQAKVIVMLGVDGRAIWRSEALLEAKYARRMTDGELAEIGRKTAEFVGTVAGMKDPELPPAAVTSSVESKKRRR
jgi:hypothetical protein